MKIQLNGTHQLVIYVDNATVLRENINTIKENKKFLLEASREVGHSSSTG
jgi:hypothetical protein